MGCPYHADFAAQLQVPPDASDGDGWIGWLDGCCGLPAWQCPRGQLHPIEADFCTYHGCPRPPWDRVAHEVTQAWTGSDLPTVDLRRRRLDLGPARDGRSTPALAGNVLVYLTESGTLIAVDFRPSPIRVDLASSIDAATLRVHRGEVLGALSTGNRIRYMSWDVRDLRRSLERGGLAEEGRVIDPLKVHPLALPTDRDRVAHGTGPLRLAVEHDPVQGHLASVYRRIAGVEPGAYLVRRLVNPRGPPVPHPDLRPQALDQMPVPIAGGIFLLGRIRWFGKTVQGALIVPTVSRPPRE